jgi:hypothetical protein
MWHVFIDTFMLLKVWNLVIYDNMDATGDNNVKWKISYVT